MTTSIFCNHYAFFSFLILYSLVVHCHYAHWCLLLSVHCHYITVYHHMILSYCALCSLLQSLQCLMTPQILPSVISVCSVLLCPLLSSTTCPLSVSTWHWCVCCFCVTVSIDLFLLSTHFLSVPYIFLSVGSFNMTIATYILSMTVSTLLHIVSVSCHCVHCCLLQSLLCLSVPHIVPSVCSVSLCPLLISTVCPLSVSPS
jgi:hypothetical protein